MVKPSEALAKNVGAARVLREMKQEDLAAAMANLGHRWTYTTVSQVEGHRRRVSIDELFGLCLALGRSIPEMLENTDRVPFDCGLGQDQVIMDHLDPGTTNMWIRGRRRLWAHSYNDGGFWSLNVQEVEP